jgi:hypothetical protein
MQDALLLGELTAILGSGPFTTLVKRLLTHLPKTPNPKTLKL